ncbi:MAG: TlpA family protein disulfide reductase [Bacteroidales bacterium]|nr:TlpA family protein disulfide reductase [Bacteroidales bacterium]
MYKIQLVVFAAILFNACDTQTEQTASISGHIPMDVTTELYVWNADTKDTISLTAGNFEYQLQLNSPGFYRLLIGNSKYELFLVPGGELRLDGDSMTNPLNIHYTGSLGDENAYLNQSFQLLNQIDYKEVFSLESEAFQHFIDSLFSQNDSLLNALSDESSFHEDFLRMIKVKHAANRGDKLLRYPVYHGYYTQTENPEMPNSYYAFIQQIDINNPEYSKLYEVKNYTHSLISYYSDKMLQDSLVNPALADAEIRTELMAITEHIKEPAVRNNLLFDGLNDHISYYGPSNLEFVIDYFNQHCTDTLYLKKMKEAIDSWASLMPGQEAPSWEAHTLSGELVKSGDFLGKYLYIDIWATWCGPCRREIPSLKELVETYKGRNLAIVSVSVDKDKEAWEKMVSEDNYGTQLFAEGAFNSDLAIKYKVNAIPRFLLIDPQGKIIHVSTERPSGKIREIFDTLPGL